MVKVDSAKGERTPRCLSYYREAARRILWVKPQAGFYRMNVAGPSVPMLGEE